MREFSYYCERPNRVRFRQHRLATVVVDVNNVLIPEMTLEPLTPVEVLPSLFSLSLLYNTLGPC